MNEPFQVRIIKRAEKQLNKKMKFQRKEAIKEIKKLARNPYLGEKKKGEKDGFNNDQSTAKGSNNPPMGS